MKIDAPTFRQTQAGSSPATETIELHSMPPVSGTGGSPPGSQNLELPLNLTPPTNIPREQAEDITNNVRTMLDTVLELDMLLEQTQSWCETFHEPQVRQGAEALSADIQGYLNDGEVPNRGDLSANSPAVELCEVFEDALSTIEEEFFDARSDITGTSDWSDEYFDARSDITGTSERAEAYFDASTGDEAAVAGRLRAVLTALERVARNEFENPHARRLSNVANMALQSVIATGIPTFVRQAVAFAIEQSLTSGNASAAARTALGAMAGSLPLLLGAAGLVHDNVRGVATTTSNLSRGSGLLVGGALMVAAGMTGSLAILAPTLAAYNLVHAAMSEAMLSWLRLQDNSSPVNAQAAAMITASSVVNTMAANQASSHGAPASGQGQASAGQGWQPLADLNRGVINAAASTAGGFLSHAWRHCSSSPEARQELRLSLEVALPERRELVQQLLGSYALGASSGTNTFLIDDMLAPFIQATGLSAIQVTAVRDALAAVIGGGQYPLMLGAMSYREPPPPPRDPEAG
ncbi:hypothetical protein [Pseudomonas chlororaphis]|uniref:hypothetical protein n=1 Tax=Pseudomonas chlororaphis TaxID=587753 RepID=UPI0015DEC4E8|nr:hypothetical protein [Pseudomonas chlororaphis]QLL13467.1 hypothetical protein H0I86_31680 [Pseudomonas chlororaphis subsp. aurantiaca]